MDQNINYGYTIGYIVTVTLGFFNLGYCFAYFSDVMNIMHEEYVLSGMEVLQDKVYFNNIVSAMIPVGAIIGGPIAGTMVLKGRRFTCLVNACVMIAACLATLYLNVVTLILGRFIMGMCIGAYVLLIPLMVCELSPALIGSQLGTVGQIQIMSGAFLAVMLGFTVPYSTADDALTSVAWKIVFCMPAVISAVQILLLLFVYNIETPNYYLITGNIDMYEQAMSRQFRNHQYSPAGNSLLEEEPKTSDVQAPKSKEVTWAEIFTHPYNLALGVSCMMAFFNQATGVAAVSYWIHSLFADGHEGTAAEMASRFGGFGLSIVGLVAAFTALGVSNHFGRKTIIQTGQVAMVVILALLTNSAFAESKMISVVLSVLYLYVYNATFGAFLWLYVSEICGAKGIATAAFVNMSACLLFGVAEEYLFTSMGATQVFLSLCVIQAIAIVVVHRYMRETKGRSGPEREKLFLDGPKNTEKEDEKGAEMEEL